MGRISKKEAATRYYHMMALGPYNLLYFILQFGMKQGKKIYLEKSKERSKLLKKYRKIAGIPRYPWPR